MLQYTNEYEMSHMVVHRDVVQVPYGSTEEITEVPCGNTQVTTRSPIRPGQPQKAPFSAKNEKSHIVVHREFLQVLYCSTEGIATSPI